MRTVRIATRVVRQTPRTAKAKARAGHLTTASQIITAPPRFRPGGRNQTHQPRLLGRDSSAATASHS